MAGRAVHRHVPAEIAIEPPTAAASLDGHGGRGRLPDLAIARPRRTSTVRRGRGRGVAARPGLVAPRWRLPGQPTGAGLGLGMRSDPPLNHLRGRAAGRVSRRRGPTGRGGDGLGAAIRGHGAVQVELGPKPLRSSRPDRVRPRSPELELMITTARRTPGAPWGRAGAAVTSPELPRGRRIPTPPRSAAGSRPPRDRRPVVLAARP